MNFYCRDSFPSGRRGHSVFQRLQSDSLSRELPLRRPLWLSRSLPVCKTTRLLHLWGEAAQAAGAGVARRGCSQPREAPRTLAAAEAAPPGTATPGDALTHFFNNRGKPPCPPVSSFSSSPWKSQIKSFVFPPPHPSIYLDFTSTPRLPP